MTYQERVLPRSGLHMQWRPESRQWRVIPEDIAIEDDPAMLAIYEEAWAELQHDEVPVITGLAGPEALLPKVSTWWVVYGELPASGMRPTVRLADGTSPGVVQLGPVWAAEWQSMRQRVYVDMESGTRDMQFGLPGQP